jgi:hypothetical protein
MAYNEDAKVWNPKMGYAMDPDLNDKVDRKVKEILSGTKMGGELSAPDEEEMRYAIFDSAIFDLVQAAQDIYCDGKTKLDDVLDMLIEAFKKLKGKEKTLQDEVRKDWDDDEEDEAEKEGETVGQENKEDGE